VSIDTLREIAAVTLVTADMTRAVRFYRSLGFPLRYGGEQAGFTSFAVGEGSINLEGRPGRDPVSQWGRVILFVSDVDAMYERALALGLSPEAPPRDAPWGERFFHLRDPDGHELSFAKPLASSTVE
jgi:catechol 2,3-dioxygenase-like lactoylglutathione lyase family enzyme